MAKKKKNKDKKDEKDEEKEEEEEEKEEKDNDDDKKEEDDKEEDKDEEKKDDDEDSSSDDEEPSSDDDDSEDKEVEVPDKFKDLVEEIEQLSVADLAELVDVLEEKFGVTPVAAAPAGGGAAGGGAAGGGEEKSSFDVVLKEIGDAKIKVIKAVREITGKGLKESKELVDSIPETVQGSLSEDKANEVKEQLEEAGAVVEVK